LWQMHYRGWEDHGIPDPFVLDYCLRWVISRNSSAKINTNSGNSLNNRDAKQSHQHHHHHHHHQQQQVPNPLPIAVHCHSGVGRTGTFILIHSLVERLKDKDDKVGLEKDTGRGDLIRQLIRLRLQRESVQGAQQLTYVYGFLCDTINQSQHTHVYYEPLVKYSRHENCYRLAAFMDSQSVLHEMRQRYAQENPGNFSSKGQFEGYLNWCADILKDVLFKDVSDEQLYIWSNRLSKLDKQLHRFLAELLDNQVSLKELFLFHQSSTSCSTDEKGDREIRESDDNFWSECQAADSNLKRNSVDDDGICSDCNVYQLLITGHVTKLKQILTEYNASRQQEKE